MQSLTLTVHAATFGWVALAPSTVAQGTYVKGFRSDVVQRSDGRGTLMLTAAQVAAVEAFTGSPDAAGLVSISLPVGKRGRKAKAIVSRPAFASAAAKAPQTAAKARKARTGTPAQS